MGNAIEAGALNNHDNSGPDSGTASEEFHLELPGDYSTFACCKIGHNYQSHPLLTMSKLQELARCQKQTNDFVFMTPETENMNAEFAHTVFDVDDDAVTEIFDRLGEPKTWVSINNIQNNPQYNEFLSQVLAPYRQQLEAEQGKILDVRSHIFVSTPPATTPFHIDKQNNLFLQLQGQKQMVLWDPYDREVVQELALEEYITADSRVRIKSAFGPDVIAKGETFSIGAGEGVYIPSTAPHMVYTGGKEGQSNELSISLAVTFYTELTRHRARILQCNSMIRKLKMSPKTPGLPPYEGNGIKALLGSGYARFKKVAIGYLPPPWSY